MSDRNLNINIRTTADTSGATQAAASLDRIRESGESISQTSGVMDRIADSLSRVKTAAGETGDAMKDGMGAEYEKALENANSKLDQYADALTAAGSRMKAAFNDNPGLTGFIDEVTNAVLTSEEFRKKLEQVDDVFEVLNNKMSDLDLGAKWGDDLDENLQQIIDGYNKEMDAATRPRKRRKPRRPGSSRPPPPRWNGWKPTTAAPPPLTKNCRPSWNPTLPSWKRPGRPGITWPRRTP